MLTAVSFRDVFPAYFLTLLDVAVSLCGRSLKLNAVYGFGSEMTGKPLEQFTQPQYFLTDFFGCGTKGTKYVIT